MLVNLMVKVNHCIQCITTMLCTFLDYYSNVLLIDESGKEISCNLFSSNSSWLPKVMSVGDILRLHRVKVIVRVVYVAHKLFIVVKIQSHCGNNQGVGTQKWGCSSVVFDGNCGSEFTPRVSSASFEFNDYDKKRVLDNYDTKLKRHSNTPPR